MNNSKNTQVNLLIVLCAVLAAILIMQLVLVPLAAKNTELAESNKSDRLAITMIQHEAELCNKLRDDNAAIAKENSQLIELMRPEMTTAELDMLLSQRFLECGLSVTDAVISVEDFGGISAASARYSGEGSYSAITELISEICTDSSLGLGSVMFKTKSGFSADYLSFDIEIICRMYAKELNAGETDY
ncbi:MAG: hypothetical protein ACI4KA_04750 [Oscillospiraceae bacterium]